MIGHFAERAPGPQLSGAENVRRQVAVAQVEPARFAIARHPFETLKRVACKAPAGRLVDHARQRVDHRVRVRRDAQAIEFDVVAGVGDDRDVFGRHHVGKAEQKFRRADAAG